MQWVHLKLIPLVSMFKFSVLIVNMVNIDSYNPPIKKSLWKSLIIFSEYKGVLRTESLRTTAL